MRRWQGCPKGARASRDGPPGSSTGSTGRGSGEGLGAYDPRPRATGPGGADGQDTGCGGAGADSWPPGSHARATRPRGPGARTWLGFRFTRRDLRRGISPEAVKRLKGRVREITRRPRGRRVERVAPELRRYRRGWRADVGYAEGRSLFTEWDSWIQRRLRGSLGKPWGPRGDTELRTRGVSRDLAWNTAKSAHGPWRLSRSPALAMAVPGRQFEGLGVPRLSITGASPPNRRAT